MFEELNNAFPDHSYFYEVNGLTMSEALERCARMAGDAGTVFNYHGKIIFAVKFNLGDSIGWATLLPGNPTE